MLQTNPRLLIFELLVIQDRQIAGKGQFQTSVLLFAISELKIKKLLVLEQNLFFKFEGLDGLLLLIAVPPDLHALFLEPVLLLVELGQLGVLERFQLSLVGLFLELHELILNLEHMKSVGS